MKYIHLSIFTLLFILNLSAQTTVTSVTNATVQSNNASEGDFYIGTEAPVNLIYIGLSDGTYHPLYSKGLEEILAIDNDATSLKIIDLLNPVNPQDIATKFFVDGQLSGGIYTDEGDLISHRTVAGNNFDLTETGVNNHVTTSAAMSFSSSNTIEFAATNGVILNNNTTITGDLTTNASFLDSGDSGIPIPPSPGDYYQLLSSTGTGTKWIYSSAAPKSLQLYSYKSPRNPADPTIIQTWPTAPTVIQTIPIITIGEESILNIDYVFTYFYEYITNGGPDHIKDSFTHGDVRSAYFRISGTDIDGLPVDLNYQALTTDKPITNNLLQGFYSGTCNSSSKLILKAGTYSVEFYTEGSFPIGTGSNSFNGSETQAPYNLSGWNFNVSITPKSI